MEALAEGKRRVSVAEPHVPRETRAVAVPTLALRNDVKCGLTPDSLFKYAVP